MSDTDPTEEPPAPSRSGALKAASKGRQSLSRVRRELSDEELSSPAVQRMLIDEIERLERENGDLRGYRERFHDCDKHLAIEKERGKTSLAGDIIFGVSLAMGSAAIGHAPAAWKTIDGPLFLAFGSVVVIGGIVFRSVQK